MKFRSAKDSVEWAYRYLHLSRSAKGIDYARKKDLPPPATQVSAHNHALHLLAIRLLDFFGGYMPPREAEESILGYYIGWIRWTALSEKERYRIRKTNSKIKEFLKEQKLFQ